MSQAEEAQNMKTADEFNQTWINVLDKIIMEWLSYSPGFMCIGHKPHPIGNKSHTICCGLNSILSKAKVLDRKYFPHQVGQN